MYIFSVIQKMHDVHVRVGDDQRQLKPCFHSPREHVLGNKILKIELFSRTTFDFHSTRDYCVAKKKILFHNGCYEHVYFHLKFKKTRASKNLSIQQKSLLLIGWLFLSLKCSQRSLKKVENFQLSKAISSEQKSLKF